jgi:serine phosphatase RsbU (regulator of sigma subunit)
VERFRNFVFDGWQRAMPRERDSGLVVVVAIDERSLATWGQWPWPRTRVAELVSRIADGKPLALGLDIYFPEPDRFSPEAIAAQVAEAAPELAGRLRALESNDKVLGRALTRAPSILAVPGVDREEERYAGAPGGPPFRFVGDAGEHIRHFRGHLRNVADVDAGAASHGLVSTAPEGGVMRRVPVVATVGGHAILGLGVELVRTAVGALAELRPGPGGLVEVRFGDYAVPAQPDGNAYLRFARHDYTRYVRASDILSGDFDTGLLEGKLVLLGFIGLGLRDQANTPLGESVYGIEVHAQVAETIIEEKFLRRPGYAPWAEAAVLALFGIGLIVVVPRWTAPYSTLLLVAGAVAMVAGAAGAFQYGGLLLDPFGPVLGTALVFGTMQAGSFADVQQQQRRLREQAARVAGELHAAQRIQMGLLPDPAKVAPGEARLDLAARIEPARSVGGDFYDCFMLDDHRLFFLVADVSGKGLPASLFMASVKNILKSAAHATQGRLGRVLVRAQQETRLENPESLFVTVFVGVLDLRTGYLECVNAGHEPPWHGRPGDRAARVQGPGGPPLGVLDEEFTYPVGRLSMRAGEWLLVLSDGVTEAMNPAGAFFGADRLQACLASLGEAPASGAIVAGVCAEVHRFAAGADPADDVTLLAIGWRGPARPGADPDASGNPPA